MAAVTALQMITRAMRIMRVLGVDQAPTASEGVDGLYALNSMTEAMGIDKGLIYSIQQISNSWTANNASRTIGSGGNFNTTRPIKVAEQGNFFRDGSTSVDYTLRWLGDRDSYDRICLKTTTGSYPEYLFVDPAFPLMTLYVWPVPSQTLTLYLNTWTPLQTFAALTDLLSMPPGYQAALEYNLAKWWKGEFGSAANMSGDDMKNASNLLSNIKSLNHRDLVARLDPALLGQGRAYNFYADGSGINQ